MKAIVNKIGDVDIVNKQISGWGFDCLGTIPFLDVCPTTGTIRFAGYTIMELYEVSAYKKN